jgi:hypothetical protein
MRRPVSALVAGLAVAAGCGAGLSETQRRERAAVRESARQDMAVRHAAHKTSCAAVALMVAMPEDVRYFTVGCGRVSHVALTCIGRWCFPNLVSTTTLDRPSRLQPVGRLHWRDPSLHDDRACLPAADVANRKFVPARLFTDYRQRPYRPGLPDDLLRAGLIASGRFKIQVTSQGRVASVEVLRSPGWLDAHWIARIETWRYQPAMLDEAPVPFCYELTFTVHVV